MRLLRRAGALKDVVRAAGLLSCTVCLNFQNIKAARVSRLQEVYEFNVRVLLDTVFIHDVVGSIFVALKYRLRRDNLSGCRAARRRSGRPRLRPRPQSVHARVGQLGRHAKASLHRSRQGVLPLRRLAPGHGRGILYLLHGGSVWQHGRCERRGAVWKQVFNRVVEDHQVTGRSQVENVVPIVTSVVNSMVRHNGYHPDQWVLGARGPRVPASLLSDESREALEVQSAA